MWVDDGFIEGYFYTFFLEKIDDKLKKERR